MLTFPTIAIFLVTRYKKLILIFGNKFKYHILCIESTFGLQMKENNLKLIFQIFFYFYISADFSTNCAKYGRKRADASVQTSSVRGGESLTSDITADLTECRAQLKA